MNIYKISRDRLHKTHQDGVSSEKVSNGEPDSFVYDILSDGRSHGSPHRPRACSMHSSRKHTHEHGVKNSSHLSRRQSLPANEIGFTKYCARTEAQQEQSNSRRINAMDDTNRGDSMRVRRVRSFRERPERTDECLRRVRSFKTTSKGLVNRGDSFKAKKESGYGVSTHRGEKTDSTLQTFNNYVIPQLITTRSDGQQSYFRVLMTGAEGVGKSSLIDQFMTSEFLGSGAFSISQSEGDRTVTLQVDGDESTLEFLQSEDFQEHEEGFQIDGFVVVYCITERVTFHIATDLMKQIRDEVGSTKAIILVGNKSDLVRKRTISQEEGRSAADGYGCKYIELSAALNHRVDELLVGIHKQIMLKSDADIDQSDCDIPKDKDRKSSFKKTKRFLEKVFLGHSGKDKNTENLYVD